MATNAMFDQIRQAIDQLEHNAKALESQFTGKTKQQDNKESTNELATEYNDVLEQEFIKDKKGQEFAKLQFEEAQKYLIMMFMDTPEGKKLADSRAVAFKAFKDDKLKSFLESKKKGEKANADVSQ